MKYLLTILTNGRPEYLERAVAAFAQHVTPAPAAIVVMDDGGQTGEAEVIDALRPLLYDGPTWLSRDLEIEHSNGPVGMCAAHQVCWQAAAASPHPWTFHLEEDFVIVRPVDLRELTAVLAAHTYLTQMALVRAPWFREIPYGGYIPHLPGLYQRRGWTGRSPAYNVDRAPTGRRPRYEWIETTRNWATNPALYASAVARRFPWSPVGGCETEIGPRILEAEPDAQFGLWGWGEPWSAHIGEARAPGAHGY